MSQPIIAMDDPIYIIALPKNYCVAIDCLRAAITFSDCKYRDYFIVYTKQYKL